MGKELLLEIGTEEIPAAFLPQAMKDMEEALLEFSDEIASRLRAEGLTARCVHVKARTGSFRTMTRAQTLPEPTDLTDEIWRVACRLLREKVDFDGEGARLLGVSVSGFQPAGTGQGSLFPDPQREKRRKAEAVVDAIRRRFGRDALRRARLAEDKGDG